MNFNEFGNDNSLNKKMLEFLFSFFALARDIVKRAIHLEQKIPASDPASRYRATFSSLLQINCSKLLTFYVHDDAFSVGVKILRTGDVFN